MTNGRTKDMRPYSSTGDKNDNEVRYEVQDSGNITFCAMNYEGMKVTGYRKAF